MLRRFFLLFFIVLSVSISGQVNTDKVMTIGRSALYYEDYVLSIQYFNQVIDTKPFLYEPWYYRGVAKYYLDDFHGAEEDCNEAIKRNPFVSSIYQLRGLCRIQEGKFDGAVDDYKIALSQNPEDQGLWYNRVLCRIQQKDYTNALLDLDTVLTRWKNFAKGYALRADAYLISKDTTKAISSLAKSLELDPYDGEAWMTQGSLYLSRQQWRYAEASLNKAIHLSPKKSNTYINRALARFNQNNLRGAMSDYDTALDLDPNNFLGHYNRGLLRAQVGDDNRAITDFDFVLKFEPDNLMALFNRALLLDKTGNLRGAISDYTRVIKQYPNFWTGLHYRAVCYRKLGETKNAEMDEFRIFKAQLDKRYGIQHKSTRRKVRKRSDVDMDKYNNLVVADEEQNEHEYKSEYRGKVQNRNVSIEFCPMYNLSFIDNNSEIRTYIAFNASVDSLNQTKSISHTIFINTGTNMDEAQSKVYFNMLDSLIHVDTKNMTLSDKSKYFFERAIAYSVIQNYENCIEEATASVNAKDDMSVVYWLRGVSKFKQLQFESSQGVDNDITNESVIEDLTTAIRLNSSNAFLYYDRGNVYANLKNYTQAINDYTEALKIDKNLPEAYYNRGLSLIYNEKKDLGLKDLSKAGELGLYTAYNVIKKYRK